MTKRKSFLSLCCSLLLLLCANACPRDDSGSEPSSGKSASSKGKQSNASKKSKSTSEAPTTIVLLHGLGASPKDFDDFTLLLKQKFGPEVTIKAPHRRDTFRTSIETQAKEVYESITGEAKGNFALVGMSQGGTVALKLKEQLERERHKVDCIVTIASPIGEGGVPVINNKVLAHQLITALESLPILSDQFKEELALLKQFDKSLPGINDLAPGSPLLKSIAAGLRNNKVPILAIAAQENGALNRFLDDEIPIDFSSQPIINGKTIEEILGDILGSSEHDLLIPTQSQLPGSDAQNVHKLTIKGAAHVSIGDGTLIFDNENAIQRQVDFIVKHLKVKKSKNAKQQ